MKYITIFPEYPISIYQISELKRYRKKVLHAQIEGAALIRILNSPSRVLRTVDGHHVNKAFIVGVRDYVDPQSRKSRLAEYERRTQVNLYVSMELATLEEVSGIISVRRIADDVELCLERALVSAREYDFVGMLTDWNTTEKLDTLIDRVSKGPRVGNGEKGQKMSHKIPLNPTRNAIHADDFRGASVINCC